MNYNNSEKPFKSLPINDFWENNCLKTRSLNIPAEIDLLKNYLWDFVSDSGVINLDWADALYLVDFAEKSKNCTVSEIYCDLNQLGTILSNQDLDYQIILFYVYITEDMSLSEVEEISSHLLRDSGKHTQAVWGLQIDSTLPQNHIVIKYASCKNGVDN